MVVVYDNGTAAISGSLGAGAGVLSLLKLSMNPGTLLASAVPGMGVGAGLAGTGVFAGATFQPASTFAPLSIVGNVSGLTLFGAPGTVVISGAGTQSFPAFSALGIGANWTVTGLVGVEISRVDLNLYPNPIPEPQLALLLLGGMVGMAGYAARQRRND